MRIYCGFNKGNLRWINRGENILKDEEEYVQSQDMNVS